MVKQIKTMFLAAIALALVLPLVACGKSEEAKGPAEKAGATMGQTVDKAAEQAGQAMEKAGDAMKEAGEKTQEAVKDAADKMKDDKK